MTHVENLNTLEKQIVINWFMYHINQNDRGKLMREFPMIYNKLVNKVVMETVNLYANKRN